LFAPQGDRKKTKSQQASSKPSAPPNPIDPRNPPQNQLNAPPISKTPTFSHPKAKVNASDRPWATFDSSSLIRTFFALLTRAKNFFSPSQRRDKPRKKGKKAFARKEKDKKKVSFFGNSEPRLC
jgi:hypothetical protein